MSRLLISILLCGLLLTGCSNKKETPQKAEGSSQAATDNQKSSPSLWLRGVERFREGVKLNDPAAQFEGIDLLEQAVQQSPNNRAAWVDLADAYIYTKNRLLVAEAINICEAMYKDETKQPDMLLDRICKAYSILGNDAAAQAIAQKWVETAPDERLSPAVLQLTLIAGQSGDIKPAITCLEGRAKNTKQPGFVYLMLASLYELDGKIPQARTALESAIKILPAESQQAENAKSELRRLAS